MMDPLLIAVVAALVFATVTAVLERAKDWKAETERTTRWRLYYEHGGRKPPYDDVVGVDGGDEDDDSESWKRR